MGHFNRIVSAVACALIAVAFTQTARAAESGKPAPLRVAYSAITVNQAIPWIAHDAGHFKKHGLDVELIHASSITAMQALLAGEVTVAAVACPIPPPEAPRCVVHAS